MELKLWRNGDVERIYINDGEVTIGFLQKIGREFTRGNDTYYDRHRNAKGDSTIYHDTYKCEVSEDVMTALQAATQLENFISLDGGVNVWWDFNWNELVKRCGNYMQIVPKEVFDFCPKVRYAKGAAARRAAKLNEIKQAEELTHFSFSL